MNKVFLFVGLFVFPLYGIWMAPQKEYGLKVPYSLGSLCKLSNAIVIGEVKSIKNRMRKKDPWGMESIVKIRIWEDIKGYWKDTVVYVQSVWGPSFTTGETVLVFLQDSVMYAQYMTRGKSCPWMRGDTMGVTGWELGKFRIISDTVRFEQYGAGKFGVPLDIARKVIRSAIKYPRVVNLKIDTIYEEAMKMLETKSVSKVRDWVYSELEKIGELSEE